MLVLRSSQNLERAGWVLLFGLGMIGREVFHSLLRFGFKKALDIPSCWHDPHGQAASLAELSGFLADSVHEDAHVSLVWSAGATDFSSTVVQLESENDAFQRVLQFFNEVLQDRNSAGRDFHFVSSAGGLFEGQRLVREGSIPTPRRGYGQFKLAQERELQRRSSTNGIRIYRPSSVYGRRQQRNSTKGLINNLVANAMTGTSSRLDAHWMALRDYVYAGDVGRYIAEQIGRGSAGVGYREFLLATGRPASIFEIKGLVERILKKPVYFRLDDSFGNHENMTFHHAALAPGWDPIGLHAGIRLLSLGAGHEGMANTA